MCRKRLSALGGFARLQKVEQQRAPCLEAVGDGRDVLRRRKAALELLALTDGDRPTARIGSEDEAKVDGSDVVVVVVQNADGLERGREVRLDLLLPLTCEPAVDVRVLRIDVPADTDRVAIVKALIAACARAPHQEYRVTVAQHDIGNHLLPRWILLGLGARSELAAGMERVEGRRQRTFDDAAPVHSAGHVLAPQSEYLLSQNLSPRTNAILRIRGTRRGSASSRLRHEGACPPIKASRLSGRRPSRRDRRANQVAFG